MDERIKKFYASDTFRAIDTRLSGLSPAIHIREHVDTVNGMLPQAGPTVLEGITFRPKSRDKLLALLRASTNGTEKRFAEGSSFDVRHWALKASFAATRGIGFREVFRFNLSDRPLLEDPDRRNPYKARWSDRDSARFGDSLTMPDVTSLHCAIADDVCNIHIDETGFVVESLDGEVSLGPDFLRHAIVELFQKTTLKEAVKGNELLTWVIDHANPIIPSTANNLSVGLSFEPIRTKNYRLTFTGSCALHGQNECSVTGTFTAKHNIGSAPVHKSPKRP